MIESDNLPLILLVLDNGLFNDLEYAADAFELLTGRKRKVTSEQIEAARRMLEERHGRKTNESPSSTEGAPEVACYSSRSIVASASTACSRSRASTPSSLRITTPQLLALKSLR